MSKKHIFEASWRYREWLEGFGQQLKKLNRDWVIKNHYRIEFE